VMRRPTHQERRNCPSHMVSRLLLSAPSAYLTAVSRAVVHVPGVGSHLQPLADAAAMAAWIYRQVPGFAQAALRSRSEGARQPRRRYSHRDTVSACESSLTGLAGADEQPWPPPSRIPPGFNATRLRQRFLHRADVSYGPSPSQVLDVWRAQDAPASPAPILIFVPGGAWLHGSRKYQGHTLIARLAQRGWLCLAIDYRVSPRHRWPRHIMDVKTAIAWARTHAQAFGGDPSFVAIAGASAGGHLAALAAVTPGDPEFDSELGGADTRVDAAVSLYGRYDWEDRSTPERDRFVGFIENLVVGKTQRSSPAVFRDASPIARIGEHTPPTFVVHGTEDSIIPVAQARAFVDTLRARSLSPVGYLELPGAQHAFDLIDGARTDVACSAVSRFLEAMYFQHSRSLAG
jgi:acetyl esterase/lipase